MDDELQVKSVRTAFNLVDYLAKEGQTGVSTIAEDLDIAVSTTYDHLSTMVELGYVRKTDREYHLSTRFLEIGERTRADIELYEMVGDNLETLADSTGETATLWTEEDGLGVIIDTAHGSESIPLDPYSGTRIELHRAAPGKAILAHLPPERVEATLDRYPPGEEAERYGIPSRTEHTIGNREDLLDELEMVRERGFATEDEELVEGVRSVAVPIFDEDRNVAGSIGIHGLSRLSDERFTDMLPDKLHEVQNIFELEYRYR